LLTAAGNRALSDKCEAGPVREVDCSRGVASDAAHFAVACIMHVGPQQTAERLGRGLVSQHFEQKLTECTSIRVKRGDCAACRARLRCT
jgi:hypothetical protein